MRLTIRHQKSVRNCLLKEFLKSNPNRIEIRAFNVGCNMMYKYIRKQIINNGAYFNIRKEMLK
jgi:hypothetical protein